MVNNKYTLREDDPYIDEAKIKKHNGAWWIEGFFETESVIMIGDWQTNDEVADEVENFDGTVVKVVK